MKAFSTFALILLIQAISFAQGTVVYDNFIRSNSERFGTSFTFKDYYGFTYFDENYRNHIWLSDGTTGNTQLITRANGNKPVVSLTNHIIHAGDYDFDNKTYDLYRTNEDASTIFLSSIDRSFDLIATNDIAFLLVDNKIWRTNGFENETYPIKYGVNGWITHIEGNQLYFITNDSLFVTDGSISGTQYLDIGNDVKQKNYGTVMNGIRYFQGCQHDTGCELWRTDGTASGTYLVKDLREGTLVTDSTRGRSSFPKTFLTIGNKVFFKTGFNELWVTDGTEAGTEQLTFSEKDLYEYWSDQGGEKIFVELNGQLIFENTTRKEGRELWISDGTPNGTRILKDIMPNMGSSTQSWNDHLVKDSYLYFSAYDGVHGSELWRTNGTTDGTQLVLDFVSGIRSSGIDHIQLVDDELFFSVRLPAFDDPKLGLGKVELTDLSNGVPQNESDEITWFRQIGYMPQISASDGVDIGNVAIDGEDNSYVVGRYSIHEGQVAFYQSQFELPFNPNYDDYDEQNYLAKFDSDGELAWAKYFGGDSYIYHRPLLEIDKTGYAIVGSFNVGDAVYDSLSITGDYYDRRLMVAKYSPTGFSEWVSYGETSNSSTQIELHDITTDRYDNVYFVGEVYRGSINWDAYRIEASSDESVAFLGKISKGGRLEWIQETSDSIRWTDAKIAIQDEQVVVSLTQAISNIYADNNNRQDHFTIQSYDLLGNKNWSKKIKCTDLAIMSDVQISPKGEIFLLGKYQGVIDFGTKELPNILREDRELGWFLAKLDQNGNFINALHDPEQLINTNQLLLEDEYFYILGTKYFIDYSYYEGYDGYIADDNKQVFVRKYDYLNNKMAERSFNKYGNRIYDNWYAQSDLSMGLFSDGSILLGDRSTSPLDTLHHYTRHYSDYSTILMRFDLPNNFPINTFPDEEELMVKIAPNPSSGFTNIKVIDTNFEQYELRVFDVTGRLVHFQTKEDNFEYQLLDLRNLANGTYFLHFRNENGEVSTLKYVKI